jgi:hypothetical protein
VSIVYGVGRPSTGEPLGYDPDCHQRPRQCEVAEPNILECMPDRGGRCRYAELVALTEVRCGNKVVEFEH